MKKEMILTHVSLLAVLLMTTVVLSAGDSRPEGQSTPQVAANGPKEIPPGWEKIVFIHYKKPRGKPADKPGGKPPKSDSQCYTFLAKGVKWDDPSFSGFLVDPANSRGLSRRDILSAVGAAADTWAGVTTAGVLPSCELESGLSADEDNPDGRNEVVFGDVAYANAIAVTIVWGIFGGPPSDRKIIEFDMIFDDVDFDWSAEGTGIAGKMDLQNIATHELGHAVGLGDLYTSSCAEVTMYGYSDYAEIDKRTLEPDDVAGLVALYGE